jgi:hypothetical protein
MLHYRPYNDPLGDIHDRFRDFVVRERLRKTNGRVDNQVLWVYPAGDRALAAKVSGLAIDTMTQWLDTKTKPAAAVDGCWTKTARASMSLRLSNGPGKCNELFPSHKNPRLVAGAPLTDDIAKCQLKPVNPADYKVQFTTTEMQDLRTIFPGGVCDYSKAGVDAAAAHGNVFDTSLGRRRRLLGAAPVPLRSDNYCSASVRAGSIRARTTRRKITRDHNRRDQHHSCTRQRQRIRRFHAEQQRSERARRQQPAVRSMRGPNPASAPPGAAPYTRCRD